MMATPPPRDPATMTLTHQSRVSQEKVSNEQILSQKLHQLSPFKNKSVADKRSETMASSSRTSELARLKINCRIDFDTIPNYLRRTNPSFEKKIRCMLPSTINLEELRDIATLMHKIVSIQIVSSLWTVYRKSCAGDLQQLALPITNQYDRHVWPKEVLALMKQQGQQQSHTDQDITEMDRHVTCLTFINDYLQQLNRQSEEYRLQLQRKTSRLTGYTRGLECNLDKFFQQGLASTRIEIDREIAFVRYDYTSELLQRAYLTQNPNEHQTKIFKRLCQLKHHQVMAKHEMNFLKQQIPIHLASHPFEKDESIAQLAIIDDIHDPNLRQQLDKQYKETAEQARIQMMNMYTECASEQREQCEKQFNMGIKQMWDTEKTLPLEQRMTPVMHNLLEQRLTNITARVECFYKFKIQLL